MTTFFNPKEDVFDIELTQYGKHLLSQGKLKPKYYAFFDSNVVYDNGFVYSSASTQDINAHQERIQDETPYLKTQYNFSERKANTIEFQHSFFFDKLGEDPFKEIKIQNNRERIYSTGAPIGSSLSTSRYKPAWEIICLNGVISSSNTNQSSSFGTTTKTELNFDLKYKTGLQKTNGIKLLEADEYLSSNVFRDSSFIAVESTDIALLFDEKNTDVTKENISLEVFEIVNSGSADEYLRPLAFYPRQTNIINGILLDQDELPNNTQELNENYVEYFLDIKTDMDVSREVLCKNIETLKSKDLFFQQYDFSDLCRDVITENVNIYNDGSKSDSCDVSVINEEPFDL